MKSKEKTKIRIGMKVRSLRDFSGVPKGTIGIIEEHPRSFPETDSVAIHWQRYEEDRLIDWFDINDEFQFLEVLK